MYEEKNKFQAWYARQNALKLEQYRNEHPVNTTEIHIEDYVDNRTPDERRASDFHFAYLEKQLGITLLDLAASRRADREMEAKELYLKLVSEKKERYDVIQLSKEMLTKYGIVQRYVKRVVKDENGNEVEL